MYVCILTTRIQINVDKTTYIAFYGVLEVGSELGLEAGPLCSFPVEALEIVLVVGLEDGPLCILPELGLVRVRGFKKIFSCRHPLGCPCGRTNVRP